VNTDDETATDVCDPVLVQAAARVGVTLGGKWHLDLLLGVGGMAAVYSATHRNGSRAAIKVLHPELSFDPAVRRRFTREGYVANAVGHENVVRVLDDDVAEDGSLFLVTELLDGETIEARRRRLGGVLPIDEVLSLADQVLDVLVAAHAKGIVHRDLKPDNLFLTRSGEVKILDFGIARLREISSCESFTKTGVLLGTPSYMPPEQVRGLTDAIDGRSDLWAVGAAMFELLAGRPVHLARTPHEQLMLAATTRAPLFASVAPDTKSSVAYLVDRALQFDRGDRWPDAATMQHAVRDAYHARHGASIASARRPTVPDTVPDRTLVSTFVAPSERTRADRATDRPVVSTPESDFSSGPPSRKSRVALVAFLVLTVIAALGVASMRRIAVTATAIPSLPTAIGATGGGLAVRSATESNLARSAPAVDRAEHQPSVAPATPKIKVAQALAEPGHGSAGSATTPVPVPHQDGSAAPTVEGIVRQDPESPRARQCLPLDDPDVDSGTARKVVCL
jgi:serine/threonine protein kinase